MNKASFYVFWLLWAVLSNAAYSHDSQDAVLVSNSRVAVTRLDLDVEITRIPADKRLEFLSSRERIGRLLKELLTQKTLAAQARDAGLDNESETRKKMELAVDRVLSNAMMTHLALTAKVPDMELRARELYKVNAEQFAEKKTVCGSHILIDKHNRSRDEAQARALEVTKLAKSGEDFGSLAVKFSEDNSAQNNKGELGCFTFDKMVKAFSDAAFAMQPEEISEPVETSFGFHVIKITDVREGGVKPFDSVKQKIIEELKADYVASQVKQAIEAISADKKMTVNEAEIQKIKTNVNSETPERPQENH